jgi:hypothetical protein
MMSWHENPSERALAAEAAPMASPAVAVGRRPRRWLRLSVRALLCLIVVIACGMAWLAQFIRAGRAQSACVKEIHRAGGWVVYDLDWNNDTTGHVFAPKWPRWLIDAVGRDYLSNVVFVTLHDRGSDAVLTAVGRLNHVKQLHRCGPSVTDAGIAHLTALRELELVTLDDSQITDAGLTKLAKLPHLRWLRIARTKVSDAGVAALRRSIPELKITR